MKALRFLTVVLFMAFMCSSFKSLSEKETTKKSETEEITKAIHSVIGWAATKDTSATLLQKIQIL